LRALVVRLQAALRLEETKVEIIRTRAGKTPLQHDDPFDKIMVA
jgi:PIN domain nuclease of toxin-antitoxin system